jgi:hypothetical protein
VSASMHDTQAGIGANIGTPREFARTELEYVR